MNIHIRISEKAKKIQSDESSPVLDWHEAPMTRPCQLMPMLQDPNLLNCSSGLTHASELSSCHLNRHDATLFSEASGFLASLLLG